MKTAGKYCLLVFVLFAGCNSDLYTKKLATESLKDNPSVSVVNGYLDLKYTENRAAGFSLFHQLDPSTRKPLLIGLQVLGSISLLVFIFWFRKKPLPVVLPFLIILSGALGNLIDRIRNGYVVDFIFFHIENQFSWPIFNVADILIVVGAGLAIIQTFSRRTDLLRETT